MTVQNLSYTFLDLYDWLAMVNDCINPYSTPVTEGMLDLVYLYNGSVCCTGVLNGVGYFSMGGGSAPADDYEEEYTEDDYYYYEEPEEEPAEEPEEEPEPEPTFPPLPSSTPSNDDWLITT